MFFLILNFKLFPCEVNLIISFFFMKLVILKCERLWGVFFANNNACKGVFYVIFLIQKKEIDSRNILSLVSP